MLIGSDDQAMLKFTDLLLATFGHKCAARRVACALAPLVGFTKRCGAVGGKRTGQAKSVEKQLWHGRWQMRRRCQISSNKSAARRVACAQARLDGLEHIQGTASGMRAGAARLVRVHACSLLSGMELSEIGEECPKGRCEQGLLNLDSLLFSYHTRVFHDSVES